MKNRQAGFTLVELLITVAVVAVLASIAVPSFRTLYVKRSVQAAADSFIVDMRFARSEAIKRSARVSMCQSVNGTSCATTGNSWQNGWLVFYDVNGNGVFDTGANGDEILRVQQALTAISSMQSAAPSSDLRKFTFQSTGWAKGATQTFFLKASGNTGASFDRLICVSIQGRAALRMEGDTSCT